MQKQGPSRALFLFVMAVLLLLAVGWVARLVGESSLLTAKDRFEAETGLLSLVDYVLPPVEDAENGELPERLDGELSDPYADGSVLYELSADGSAVLSVRHAVDLWESRHDSADGRQRPILQWRVPPPSL